MSESNFVSVSNENTISEAIREVGAVNFDLAERLPGGGTICEAYKTVLDGHIVFVKRLKREYADKASYLSALKKEFEMGAQLHHPALPDYRRFFGDYIVMDYVDGFTIADLAKNEDPWIADEDNVRNIMNQLLDVVDYLHQHNVVHCDIKADNVMITAGTRNVKLIDLDKCYTYVHDKRISGSASNYGLGVEKAGDPTLDFRGIAKVLEYIERYYEDFDGAPFLRFVKECRKKATTYSELKRALKPLLLSAKNGAGAETGYFVPFTSPVNFNESDKLTWSSQYCEYFRTTQNIRRFIVKRINAQCETDPVLVFSLKKDYESICDFDHPCLPRYRDYKCSYIMMDNMIGATLESLIKRNDERLRDVKFVRKFLMELVDVVDYLHKRSVVHCNIYARDILITPGSTTARLLNFERCYSPSQFYPPIANPEELGLSIECVGDRRLDYRGLGRITIYMKQEVEGFPFKKFKRFIKACFDDNTSIEKLQKTLKWHWWNF